MKIILLTTPQHTGSHFTRMFLDIHPEISPCIIQGNYGLKPWENELANQYLIGNATYQDLLYMLTKRTASDGFAYWNGVRKRCQMHGLKYNQKIKTKYLMFLSHIDPFIIETGRLAENNDPNVKVVTTIRDIDKCIETVKARKAHNESEVVYSIMKGLDIAKQIPNAFVCNVSQTGGNVEEWKRLMDFLGLRMFGYQIEMIRSNPKINSSNKGEKEWQHKLVQSKPL